MFPAQTKFLEVDIQSDSVADTHPNSMSKPDEDMAEKPEILAVNRTKTPLKLELIKSQTAKDGYEFFGQEMFGAGNNQ